MTKHCVPAYYQFYSSRLVAERNRESIILCEHAGLSKGLFVNHYLSVALRLEQILPVGFT